LPFLLFGFHSAGVFAEDLSHFFDSVLVSTDFAVVLVSAEFFLF
jgi:hypothetical protein